MHTSELNQLIRHMQWSDASVWTSVMACPEAHADTRTKLLLHHLHGVQWAYLQIWRGDALEIPDVSTFSDIAAICSWCREYYRELDPFLATLDPDVLKRHVEFPWAKELLQQWGEARPVTLGESVLQTSLHSTYHRGQVNSRLREMGAEPPLVDFVAWIWMGRPEPDWKQEA